MVITLDCPGQLPLTVLNIWSKFSDPDKQVLDTVIRDTHPDIR